MVVRAIQFVSCISLLLDQVDILLKLLVEREMVLLHVKGVVCTGVHTHHVVHSRLRGAPREYLSVLSHRHLTESHRVDLGHLKKLLVRLLIATLIIANLELFDPEANPTELHDIAKRNLDRIPDFFQLVRPVLNLLAGRQFFGALV